jgi:hypothetical protein
MEPVCADSNVPPIRQAFALVALDFEEELEEGREK